MAGARALQLTQLYRVQVMAREHGPRTLTQRAMFTALLRRRDSRARRDTMLVRVTNIPPAFPHAPRATRCPQLLQLEILCAPMTGRFVGSFSPQFARVPGTVTAPAGHRVP